MFVLSTSIIPNDNVLRLGNLFLTAIGQAINVISIIVVTVMLPMSADFTLMHVLGEKWQNYPNVKLRLLSLGNIMVTIVAPVISTIIVSPGCNAVWLDFWNYCHEHHEPIEYSYKAFPLEQNCFVEYAPTCYYIQTLTSITTAKAICNPKFRVDKCPRVVIETMVSLN